MPNPSARPVAARILWPALGFPAVIAPQSGGARSPADSDATRTICVLLLSNMQTLTSQDVTRYLRCVPWDNRARRTIKAGDPGSFSPNELTVRNGLVETGPEDAHGKPLTFGGDRQGRNAITVSLSKYVRRFYARPGIGLTFLHEIRVSEQALARLTGDQFHLFWNKEEAGQEPHSREMTLLLDQFATKRLNVAGPATKDRSLLMNGYRFEYGGLHHPYNQQDRGEEPTEVLHPVFVWRKPKATLTIGHVTDTHVDIRNDVYARNLQRKVVEVRKATSGRPVEFNNWNESFLSVYKDARDRSDLILLTGDLIDYGRGHIGNAITDHLLGRDDQYHLDRNWFLFYYLLTKKEPYRKPVYTILGNHDWRLNPYPPFAPSTPEPEELIHNSANFPRPERAKVLKKVIELAHGDGHDRSYSYADLTRDVVEIVKSGWKAAHLIPSALFGSRANLDFKKLPTHTTEESVAWYLLVINPFLDYQFSLPTGHQVLMLDFAENEEIRNNVENHAQGPRALDCLTPLQQWHIERFIKSPGRAKTIGIHVPPLGPRPGWSVNDLRAGIKTYKFPESPRYKNANLQWRFLRNQPLPLMAVVPESFSPWLAAAYGSFVHKDTRKWFIEKLVASPSVRLVLSGHIHRQGLLTAHWRSMPVTGEGERVPRIFKVLGVRSVAPQAVKDAKAPMATSGETRLAGPLYINSTSAGPKGYQYYDAGDYRNEPPGYSRIELANDGTIKNLWVVFVQPGVGASVRAQAG